MTNIVQPQYHILVSVLVVNPYYNHKIVYKPQYFQYYPLLLSQDRILFKSRAYYSRNISRYVHLTWFEPGTQDYICTLNVTNTLSVLVSNDVSTKYCPVSGFRSIPGYTNPLCDCNLIGGCFTFNRKIHITQWLVHSCLKHWINAVPSKYIQNVWFKWNSNS